jgi:cell division septal protein FtsQ
MSEPEKRAPAPAAFSPEDMARRKRRSVALALVLFGLVVFFFVVTLVKTGPAILNRPL